MSAKTLLVGPTPISQSVCLDDREEAPASVNEQWLWLDELNVPSVLYTGEEEVTNHEGLEEPIRYPTSLCCFAQAMNEMVNKTRRNRLRMLCMSQTQLSKGLFSSSFSSALQPTVEESKREHGEEGRGDRRLKLYLHLLLEAFLPSTESAGNDAGSSVTTNNGTKSTTTEAMAPPSLDETVPSPLIRSLWHAVQAIHSELATVLKADEEDPDAGGITSVRNAADDEGQPALVEVARLLEESCPTTHSSEPSVHSTNGSRTNGITSAVKPVFSFTNVLHGRYPRLTVWIEEQWSQLGRILNAPQDARVSGDIVDTWSNQQPSGSRFQCQLAWRALALTVHMARLEWNRAAVQVPSTNAPGGRGTESSCDVLDTTLVGSHSLPSALPPPSPLQMSDLHSLKLLLVLVPLLQHRIMFSSSPSSPTLLTELYVKSFSSMDSTRRSSRTTPLPSTTSEVVTKEGRAVGHGGAPDGKTITKESLSQSNATTFFRDVEDYTHREQATRQLLRLLLQYYDPELSLHLESHRVDVSMYLYQWMQTWFVAGQMHLPLLYYGGDPLRKGSTPDGAAATTLLSSLPPSNIRGHYCMALMLPLIDYIIILEKRGLLPYAAIGLLLSHRNAFLQMGEDVNNNEAPAAASHGPHPIDNSAMADTATTAVLKPSSGPTTYKAVRGTSAALDKILRELPMTTVYYLSSPHRFAEVFSSEANNNNNNNNNNGNNHNNDKTCPPPPASSTISRLVHAATADPQLTALGSVPLSPLPLPFAPPPSCEVPLGKELPGSASASVTSSAALQKAAAAAVDTPVGVPLPLARIVFQNAQLLYNATPLSAQRALQSLRVVPPALIVSGLSALRSQRDAVEREKDKKEDGGDHELHMAASGDVPGDAKRRDHGTMAVMKAEEECGFSTPPDGMNKLSSGLVTSVYDDPSHRLRQASFYAQYYAALPVLPLEDCDVLLSFGTSTTSTAPHWRLPLRILDCRALKSFEYARLPESIFVGDLVSLDDLHLSRLISRATARRGEHLVLFGAGRSARVSAATGARSGLSGEEETKTLMLLSLRLVQNARLPFVSLCVEGLEGLRRLIYHRRLPLQRGPVPRVPSPAAAGQTAFTSTSSVLPSGAALLPPMTKLAETGTAVIGSMKHLFTFGGGGAAVAASGPSLDNTRELSAAMTTTTSTAQSHGPRERLTGTGPTDVRTSAPHCSNDHARSRCTPPIIPSHSPSSPPPPSAVATAVAETAAELRERSERGIATLGEWGRGALGKLKEATTSAAQQYEAGMHLVHRPPTAASFATATNAGVGVGVNDDAPLLPLTTENQTQCAMNAKQQQQQQRQEEEHNFQPSATAAIADRDAVPSTLSTTTTPLPDPPAVPTATAVRQGQSTAGELASAATEKVNGAATAVAAAASSIFSLFGVPASSSNPLSPPLPASGSGGAVALGTVEVEDDDGDLSPYFSVGEPLDADGPMDRPADLASSTEVPLPPAEGSRQDSVAAATKGGSTISLSQTPTPAASPVSAAVKQSNGKATVVGAAAVVPTSTATTAIDNGDSELVALGLITSLPTAAPTTTTNHHNLNTASDAPAVESELPLLPEDSIDAMFDEMFGAEDSDGLQLFSAGRNTGDHPTGNSAPVNPAVAPAGAGWSLTDVEEDDLFADLAI